MVELTIADYFFIIFLISNQFKPNYADYKSLEKIFEIPKSKTVVDTNEKNRHPVR